MGLWCREDVNVAPVKAESGKHKDRIKRKEMSLLTDSQSLEELYSSFSTISSGRYGSQLRRIIGAIPLNPTQTREVRFIGRHSH